MSGNRIEVRTLNLDGDFDSIRKQLDGIAEKYLGLTEKRVQTAEMQKSAATIDVAGGLHSWPEY